MVRNNSSVLSDTITYIRFPLIVCVVMLHTFILGESQFGIVHVPVGKFPIFDIFVHIMKDDIGEMAVPLFFFISGFLFFYKTNFNFSIYHLKLKRRFYSLFIPYFFWNIAYIAFIMIVQMVHPGWTDNRKAVLDLSFSDFIDAFWTLNQGLIPLWFIRDLMVINLFTPLIHFLIKHFGLIPILMIGIMYFIGIGFYLPGIGTRSSFYYILGAYFSITKFNYLKVLDKFSTPLVLAVPFLILIETYIWRNFGLLTMLNRLVLLFGVITIPIMIASGIKRQRSKPSEFLAESSFFVFVFHMFIIYIPSKFWVLFLPVNTITAITMQVLIPIVISYICVAIYYCLKKIVPKFSLFIVGGR
jgi:surface polysaccharide O-acyltransferase-like enzyme